MPMTEEEVFAKVKESLVDALGVDDDEVTSEATLTGDLGAESIDFLDIVFRLEKAFDIKIPRGELFPDNILNNPEFVQDGRLTEKGLPTPNLSSGQHSPHSCLEWACLDEMVLAVRWLVELCKVWAETTAV